MLKSNIQIFFSFLKILLAIHHRLKDWPAFNVYVYRFHGNIDCLRKNAKLQSISNVPKPPPPPPSPSSYGTRRIYKTGNKEVLSALSYFRFAIRVELLSQSIQDTEICEERNLNCRKRGYLHFIYVFVYLFIDLLFFKLQKHNYLHCTCSTTIRHNTYST